MNDDTPKPRDGNRNDDNDDDRDDNRNDNRNDDNDGMDVSDLRRSITGGKLERADLLDDPVDQFERWFRQACDAIKLDPNAMCLATVDARGQPSSRTVLLKYFDHGGYVFFTNLSSKKALDIAQNPRVSLLFFWPELARQIRIDGKAEPIPTRETFKYFMTRPRGSQIGAWVSAQSSIIHSRSLLEAKFDELKRKFGNGEVPLPSFWGGYRVVADEYEFWQGRSNRLHDRFRYTPGEDAWHIERLCP